jgi:hypothetical protein
MNVLASLLLSACLGVVPTGPASRPIEVSAGVGAFQSVHLGSAFALRLAVTVTGAEQKPVPDARVTFTAPARGPSGRFATRTHPRRVTIATDACGVAVAPPFTANRQAGGYIVTAGVERVRPAAFALVNTAPGQQP